MSSRTTPLSEDMLSNDLLRVYLRGVVSEHQKILKSLELQYMLYVQQTLTQYNSMKKEIEQLFCKQLLSIIKQFHSHSTSQPPPNTRSASQQPLILLALSAAEDVIKTDESHLKRIEIPILGAFEFTNTALDDENTFNRDSIRHADTPDANTDDFDIPPLVSCASATATTHSISYKTMPQLTACHVDEIRDEQPETDEEDEYESTVSTESTEEEEASANCKADGKPFECRLCAKCFQHKASLQRHLRNHRGERPHQCEFCQKAFTTKYQLKIHRRSHTGEMPHECSICGQSFRQISHLVTHKRRHTGERPYKCTICEKAFTQKSTLTVHGRIHDKVKPYVCSCCDRAFTQKHSLQRHIKSKHPCFYDEQAKCRRVEM